jgi:hypothetical protein
MEHAPDRLAGAGSQTATCTVPVASPPEPLAARVKVVVLETWVETFPLAAGVTCPIPGAMLTVLAPDTDQLRSTTPPSPITIAGVAAKA